MVSEGWSLSDFIAFAEEYKLTFIVQDSTGATIPESEYNNYSSATITDQSRKAGDRILSNVTQKITINATIKSEEPKNDDTTNTDNP